MNDYVELSANTNTEHGGPDKLDIELDEMTSDGIGDSYVNKDRHLFRYKSSKTVVFFVTWIGFGVTACMVGTTLPDFLRRIKIDNEEYGRLKLVENIVSGIIGLLVGLNLDRFQDVADLILSSTLIIFGCCQILLPWCGHQYVALLLMSLMNITGYITGGLGTSYVMAMWGERTSFPLHFLYLGFPIGCMLGPLFARPFISSQPHEFQLHMDSTNSSDYIFRPQSNGTLATLLNTSNIAHDNNKKTADTYSNTSQHAQCAEQCSESQIEIPFGVSGGVLVVCGLAFLAFYMNWIKQPKAFRLQRQAHRSFKDICNTDLWAAGKPCFGVLILTVVIVYHSLLLAIEGPLTGLFLFTYAVKGKYKLSSSEAAYLDTSFKASMLIGRVCFLPISHFCSIKVMIFFELVISCIASVFLATYGTHSKENFWIILCVLNFWLAPLWPGGYVWANRYIQMYTSLIAISDVFMRISDGVFSWLVGYIIEYQDPNIMWYILSLLFFIILTFVTIGQLAACKYGERFSQEMVQEYLVDRDGASDDIQTQALLEDDPEQEF